MKRKYIPLHMEEIEMQPEGCFLVGSITDEQVLIEKEFNIHTDPYEDKTFDWDNTHFE